MDTLIIRWSYWVAILLTGLALVARAANAVVGPTALTFGTRGNAVGYRTFLDGALVLFLLELGTAAYASVTSRGAGR